jgi:CRISPR/Cas system CSM-associated protein Csm3 (group 7 of RAMP superfamily)
MYIGTGFSRGLVNRTVVRNRDGLVYVPGSALKGKVREACESLARLYEITDCRAPRPGSSPAHQADCLICRMFGAPAQPSRLRWRSAQLTQEWMNALKPANVGGTVYGQTLTRTQVQLSRRRGMAAEAHLYTSEYTLENLTFISSPAIEGYLALTPVTGEPGLFYEVILLLCGLKMLATIGGSVSRGAGQCSVTLPEKIQIGEQEMEIEHYLNNLEYLYLYRDEIEEAS